MNQEILSQVDSLVRLYVIPTLWKLTGAVAIWVGGSWAIRLIRATLSRFLRLRHVDETIALYLDTGADILLKLLTLIAVLGVLGIETTSFAALLAALGLAIGAAWSGLLANFAAGSSSCRSARSKSVIRSQQRESRVPSARLDCS